MEYVHHYRSPLGALTMASDGNALTGLWFDGQRYFADTLDGRHEERALPVFERTERWLDLYFSGREPDFTPPLVMKTTPFRRAVWELLLTVPYGRTTTYGALAARLEKQGVFPRVSAISVGGAVAHNALSLIVPCHRVVGADGSLIGYAAGLDKKIGLLTLEKADLKPLLFSDGAPHLFR